MKTRHTVATEAFDPLMDLHNIVIRVLVKGVRDPELFARVQIRAESAK